MNEVLSFCLSVFKGVASGTLFSCQRHFIFFLSLTILSLTTKAEIATWDCWCLSKEGCCSHAVEQHQGFGQSIKISLFSLGTDFFLNQAPSKYIHHGIFPSIAVCSSSAFPSSPLPVQILIFPPSSPIVFVEAEHSEVHTLGRIVCEQHVQKIPGTVVQVIQCAVICPIHH